MNNKLTPSNLYKKPWYKRWYVWVAVGVAFTLFISFRYGHYPDENKNIATTSEYQDETQSTQSAKETEKEFKKSCKTITFKKLARNPDKHKGENFKIKGQVIQVLDSDSWFNDSTALRINITQDGTFWTDTIISAVNIPKGDDRILDDDIITLWGTCKGLYTYKSVLGQNISLPRVDIEYYKIENE